LQSCAARLCAGRRAVEFDDEVPGSTENAWASHHLLPPEPIIILCLQLGADIIIPLDELPPYHTEQSVLEASLQMAAEWSSASERQMPRAHLPWALQLQRAMAAAGVAFDPAQRAPLQQAAVRRSALQHHLQRVAEAAQRPGASRMRHYFVVVRPGCLAVDGYTLPAYVTEVRERHRRIALAEIRSGVHWGAEERDRLLGTRKRPASERECMHCAAQRLLGRVEDAEHMVFDCVAYDDLRALHPELFPAGQPRSERPTLAAFLEGPCGPLARFTGACRRRGRRALGLPP